MADVLLATILTALGLIVLITTILAGANKPIPDQGPSLRAPLIAGGAMTLAGILYWSLILG
ncbi:hypothetical protein K1W69_17405 [Hoeflea sp. WL0058]|uniref:Uncharacterized protein n=1 Tax=Flavimaribacter sediminis TaxID=2865987 RepID=A0AAE3D2D5_9HYPH|nr:hypothetical protein [Flavimaribacter sediminis]MBW8638977.1 hypothetical protein [Flavimaribacter sediminis]